MLFLFARVCISIEIGIWECGLFILDNSIKCLFSFDFIKQSQCFNLRALVETRDWEGAENTCFENSVSSAEGEGGGGRRV